MIFLQCVPHDLYFQWQIEVQITNFRKFNVAKNMEIIVWYPKDSQELANWKKIEEKYPEARFYYYEDEGVDLGLYIPQLRPHSLKKHFKGHADRLKGETFFYHDSDIIFRELPDFETLVKDDICWQSNCSGYLDYSYMRSKEVQGNMPEEQGIRLMAEIGEITVETIKEYDGRTGGAQNVLKGIDATYWEDVERISLEIRRKFFYGVVGSINQTYFQSENHGWQSWTCDMWAVNFALWKRGIKTNTTPELDFSWGTDSWDAYMEKKIMHNAGVTPQNHTLFCKSQWINKSPIGINLPLPPSNTASKAYVDAIREVN